MIQISVKEMCNISLQGWKGNAICEFLNNKCQKLKDGINKKLLKYSISIY